MRSGPVVCPKHPRAFRPATNRPIARIAHRLNVELDPRQSGLSDSVPRTSAGS